MGITWNVIGLEISLSGPSLKLTSYLWLFVAISVVKLYRFSLITQLQINCLQEKVGDESDWEEKEIRKIMKVNSNENISGF